MNAYTIENTELTFDSELYDSMDWICMEDEELDQQIERFTESDLQMFIEE